MDFVTKSFLKDETLTSWSLLQHICPHFWAWLLNTIAITPKSEDKYVVKVFNSSEFHLSEMNMLRNPYFRYILNLAKYNAQSLESLYIPGFGRHDENDSLCCYNFAVTFQGFYFFTFIWNFHSVLNHESFN